jgi:hypothetical protein
MSDRELDGFFLALDEHPADELTSQALADWYEEHGQAAAATCLRWAARHSRRPFLYRRLDNVLTIEPGKDFREGWYWWGVQHQFHGGDWGHPAECRLPPRLWELLPHTFPHRPSVFKQYPARRAAYEALIAAWAAFHRPS